jgi:hypothetical protein
MEIKSWQSITKALIGQDLSEDLKAECSAHLDTLMALGTAKTEYYAELLHTALLGAGKGTDRTFPITTIQSFIFDTKAYTSDNAKNITDVVNGAIKGFVEGDNVSAVGTIVPGFVTMLFGASEGSEHEIRRYCAILEGVSMVRLDFAGWSRTVTSTSLKSKCDKVSSLVLYRSFVNMKEVSLNDFIAVYQQTVKAKQPDLDAGGVLTACKNLYLMFNPEKHDNVLRAAAGSPGDVSSQPSLQPTTFQPSVGHESLDVFRKHRVEL